MHDILSPESDADMLYHERVGPELTRQVWNLADEDIDGDFLIIPEQYPSVYVNPAQGLQDIFNCIIWWILLVLCLWSSFCVISDNAMEILLEFLRAVFDSLATVVPGIGSFAALFPKSLLDLSRWASEDHIHTNIKLSMADFILNMPPFLCTCFRESRGGSRVT